MSDKNINSIQDRGWNEMHSILDKELPKKKKRRKFGLWFLFGGAAMFTLFLIGLFIVAEWDTNSAKSDLNTKNDIDHKGSTSIVTSNYSTSPELKKTDTNDQPSVNKKSDQVNTPHESSKSVLKENRTIQFRDQISTQNKMVEDSAIKTNIDLEKPAAKNIIYIDEMNKTQMSERTLRHEEDLIIAARMPSVSELEINATHKKSPLIGPIENTILKGDLLEDRFLVPLFKMPRPNAVLLKHNEILDVEIQPMVIRKSQKSLSPYLFAHANHQISSNGLGYGLGAGLNYGTEDLEFYAESGFYRSSWNNGIGTQEQSFGPTSSPEEIESNENFSLDGSTEFDINVLNFSNLTTSTNEIRIGVGMRKLLFSKLKLDMGISYSRLISATNKSFEFQVEEGAALDIENSVSISSKELYNSSAYSTYDIVPQIGIAYSISHHIDIGFNLNIGLINLISDTENGRLNNLSSEDATFRRDVSLKVRYQF